MHYLAFLKQHKQRNSCGMSAKYVLIIALINVQQWALMGQSPISINQISKTLLIGQKQNNFLETATTSTDGGILAVGYTEGYGWSGDDVLVVKLDAQGNRIFEKTIGTPLNDRASAITDDRFGTIYVAGVGMDNNADVAKRKGYIWLKSLTDKGVFIAEIKVAETLGAAQINYMRYDKNQLILYGVEQENLKSWVINVGARNEGSSAEQSATEGLVVAKTTTIKARTLDKLVIKKTAVMVAANNTPIFMVLGNATTIEHTMTLSF
jgi:hypothetical protein